MNQFLVRPSLLELSENIPENSPFPECASRPIIEVIRPVTTRAHPLGICNNQLKLMKLAWRSMWRYWMKIWMKLVQVWCFEALISLSPFRRRCGTTLYLSNES